HTLRPDMIAKERTWTAERVELLKSCLDAGLSCGQIAREIGVSRNAVIGKINRLQLPRCNSVVARQARRKPVPPTRPPGIVTQHHILMALRAEPQPAAEEVRVPGAYRCSLMELNDGKCRWPINEPGAANFCFCGNEAVESLPYCAAHARIAYQPAARQRRARA